MFQNIRKQKEHAFQMGYQQARLDMGLPPVLDADKPVPAASITVTTRQLAEAIRRFSVVEDGVVKIPADTLALIQFLVDGADDPPAGR